MREASIIDLSSLGGLLLHFRSCDDTLENACFSNFQIVACVEMNNFEIDERNIL